MNDSNSTTPEMSRESVWDYPRPPALEKVKHKLKVVHDGQIIAETTRGWRVLEESHPPTYYFPREDVDLTQLDRIPGKKTLCEWKGTAHYYRFEDGPKPVAWSYDNPRSKFDSIAGAISFYAERVDEAYVGDERVKPQAGDFYGGWITDRITGPFKGPAGTEGW